MKAAHECPEANENYECKTKVLCNIFPNGGVKLNISVCVIIALKPLRVQRYGKKTGYARNRENFLENPENLDRDAHPDRGKRREAIGERREAKGERRMVRGERREARGERREANGERREAKGERREARGERLEARG